MNLAAGPASRGTSRPCLKSGRSRPTTPLDPAPMEVPRIRSDATAASPLRRVGAEAARPDGSGGAPREGASQAGSGAQQSSAPAPPRPDRPLDLLGRLVALLPDVGPEGVEPDLATLRLLEVAEGASARADGEGSRLPSAALREVLSRLVRPGGDGAHLRARVRAAAGDPTALLAALQGGSPGAEGTALERLAAILLPGGAVPGDELEALVAALARVGRAAPVQAGGAWGTWIQGLADALAAALGTAAPELRRALERGGLAGREALALRALLESGALSPATRRALLGSALTAAEDRGQLATLLQELPEGEARERGQRALRGLEADRLLALVRQAAGDELRTSLPFPDGSGLTVLHLFVRPDRDGSAAGPAPVGPAGWRVRLGLDLQALGPLRLDLLWRQERLVLSIACGSAETLHRLGAAEGQLAEHLAAEGQEVDLVLSLASEQDLDLSAESLRIPAPEGESWMDLAG